MTAMGQTVLLVPLWLNWALITLVLLTLLALPVFLWRRRRKDGQPDPPDWSIPQVDAYCDGTSFFHTWDPAAKVASLLGFSFFLAAVQTLLASVAGLILALVAVRCSRIPWYRVQRRLLAMAAFLLLFVLVLPFTAADRPGELLVRFPLLPGLPFHGHGLVLALTIVLKACGVAILMEPMLGTAPLAVTLQGLSRLGVPSSLVQMILLCHRYLFVFVKEINRMYRGMRVRGFSPRSDLATMRAMGNFFGMLFVRSFDRTQRVFEAMQSRGYAGHFPTYVRGETTGKDLAKGGLWIMLGLLLLVLDRQSLC